MVQVITLFTIFSKVVSFLKHLPVFGKKKQKINNLQLNIK